LENTKSPHNKHNKDMIINQKSHFLYEH